MTNSYQSHVRTLSWSHVRPVSSHVTDHVTGLVIARGCSLPPYTKNENPRGDYSVSRSGGVGSLSVSLFLRSQTNRTCRNRWTLINSKLVSTLQMSDMDSDSLETSSSGGTLWSMLLSTHSLQDTCVCMVCA